MLVSEFFIPPREIRFQTQWISLRASKAITIHFSKLKPELYALEKLQTIRKWNPRKPRYFPTQRLHFWWRNPRRTRKAYKLGKGRILQIAPLQILDHKIKFFPAFQNSNIASKEAIDLYCSGTWIPDPATAQPYTRKQAIQIATLDGFESLKAFFEYFDTVDSNIFIAISFAWIDGPYQNNPSNPYFRKQFAQIDIRDFYHTSRAQDSG